MNTIKPLKSLTTAEVKNVILKFWYLNAGKAHIADFLPILDESSFSVILKERGRIVEEFDGIRGLQDHQDGKGIYYNQRFILKSIKTKVTRDRAVSHTTSVWDCLHCEPAMVRCEHLKAILHHTWIVRRSPTTQQAIIVSHTCDYFRYLPNFAPKFTRTTEFHLKLPTKQ
jgi:hypothetical protein